MCTHPPSAKGSEPVAGVAAASLQQRGWSPALGAGGDIELGVGCLSVHTGSVLGEAGEANTSVLEGIHART